MTIVKLVTAAAPDVVLRGVGATFPGDVYQNWLATYKSFRANFADIQIKYDARGSGYGKKSVTNQLVNITVEFGASESVFVDSDYQAFPDLQMVPALAGWVITEYIYMDERNAFSKDYC